MLSLAVELRTSFDASSAKDIPSHLAIACRDCEMADALTTELQRTKMRGINLLLAAAIRDSIDFLHTHAADAADTHLRAGGHGAGGGAGVGETFKTG